MKTARFKGEPLPARPPAIRTSTMRSRARARRRRKPHWRIAAHGFWLVLHIIGVWFVWRMVSQPEVIKALKDAWEKL